MVVLEKTVRQLTRLLVVHESAHLRLMGVTVHMSGQKHCLRGASDPFAEFTLLHPSHKNFPLQEAPEEIQHQ